LPAQRRRQKRAAQAQLGQRGSAPGFVQVLFVQVLFVQVLFVQVLFVQVLAATLRPVGLWAPV
jgi:hypothetical protein